MRRFLGLKSKVDLTPRRSVIHDVGSWDLWSESLSSPVLKNIWIPPFPPHDDKDELRRSESENRFPLYTFRFPFSLHRFWKLGDNFFESFCKPHKLWDTDNKTDNYIGDDSDDDRVMDRILTQTKWQLLWCLKQNRPKGQIHWQIVTEIG